MTVTAKFQGKCKACNGIIPKGSPIEWSKGAGARHIECTNTPEGIAKCDAARSQAAWNASRAPKCPTCGGSISPGYARRGLQCDFCANAAEGLYGGTSATRWHPSAVPAMEEVPMEEFFPGIKDRIPYDGPESRNPLAFRYYNPAQIVGQKTMEEHLRFSVAYWHTFKGTGQDPFGDATFFRPWNRVTTPMERAEDRLRAAFEFFRKLGAPFYCFHDLDLAPEGETFSESCRNLERMVEKAKRMQEESGVKLLWGTANLFSHPRYAHGASTNPDARVFAYAAAQVKHAMAATRELGGISAGWEAGATTSRSSTRSQARRET